ncbi:MAG: AEC family transporter [Desulfitobacteriaceae bacterium]|nr:AEC family transporter [Desulfitobacteriaceae bacterium]
MLLSQIFSRIAVLFIVALIGYIAAKVKILDEVASQRFSKFVINISAPLLIISSVIGNSSLRGINDILLALLLAFGYYIIMFFVAIPITKLINVPREERNLYRFMLIFPNVGFMGFPIINSIYGKDAIFYVSIYNLPSIIFLFSLGIYLVRNQKDQMDFNIKQLINPSIIAFFIAILIFILKIQLPQMINDTINMLGDITIPLSLLVIGSSLSTVSIKELLLEKRLYLITVIGNIIIPVTILLLLRLIIINKVIIGVTVLLVGMPVASLMVMFCHAYEGNVELAAKAVMFTTLFSIVSIPFLAYLLSRFALL